MLSNNRSRIERFTHLIHVFVWAKIRDVLHTSTKFLPVPNLQLIAKGEEGSTEEMGRLTEIVLALVVQVRFLSMSLLLIFTVQSREAD